MTESSESFPPPGDSWKPPIAPSLAEPPPKKGLRRTWVIVLLSVLGFLCLLCIVCFVSCGLLYNKGKKESSQQIVKDLKVAATHHPQAAEYHADLNRFATIAKKNQLDLAAYTRLVGRFQLAQEDRMIDPKELDSMMVIIRNINKNQGSLSHR